MPRPFPQQPSSRYMKPPSAWSLGASLGYGSLVARLHGRLLIDAPGIDARLSMNICSAHTAQFSLPPIGDGSKDTGQERCVSQGASPPLHPLHHSARPVGASR